MRSNKEIRTITPMEALKMFNKEMPEHIRFNPELTKDTGAQYHIGRKSTHDGTLIFERELIGRVMENLVNQTSFFNHPDFDVSGAKAFRYEVGLLTIESVYGVVELPAGTLPGEEQTVTIPVRCEVVRG